MLSKLTLGEQAEKALRIVQEAPEIAYDTETTGLDWRRNHVVGYVITESRENNFYIPVRHGGGANLLDPECPSIESPDDPNGRTQHRFEKELAKAFEIRKKKKLLTIAHNAKYDLHMSANHGIDLGRYIECTHVNEGLIDEYARGFGLDDCSKRHGVTVKKGDELYQHLASKFGGPPKREQMANFWKLPGTDPIGVDYAIGDGISTLELRASQIKEIAQTDELGWNREFIHDIERRLIYTVFRMERRGIRVSEERIHQVRHQLAEKLAEAKELMPEINVRSPTQMKEYMESIGRTDWPTTSIGNPSFTEKWLKTFPQGKAIVDVRKITNLINTFIGPLEERHMFEGRVHASLNQMKSDDYGTVSGRFSCSDPNLQQVPKHEKELAKIFRSLFIPDDGMEFYEADYSQCEPRLFAHYSQDKNLVEGYSANPPRDVHHLVAEWFNVERDPTAKRMNMGIFTGMYPPTFSQHMGWSLDKATEMWNKWFEAFPGVKDFQEGAKNAILDSGYVRTILGRRCHLDNRRFAYRATSKVIQGGNADIVKYKLLLADELLESRGDPAHLLMTVHDSYEYQCPIGPEGEAISRELVEMWIDVQTPPIKLRVPFKMDVGKGRDWAEATFGGK